MRDRDGRDNGAHHKQAHSADKAPGRKTQAEIHEHGELKARGDGASLLGGVPWQRNEDAHENEQEEEKEEEQEGQLEAAQTAADHADDDDGGDDGDDGDDGGDSADEGAEQEDDEAEQDGPEAEAKAASDKAERDETGDKDGEDEGKEREQAHAEDHDSDTDDVDEQGQDEIENDESDDEEQEGEEYSEGQQALDDQLEPGGEGQRLDRRIQQRLEQETGYALDGVRIHAGSATTSKLQHHGALGAAKGKNILLDDVSKAQDYDLIRHEVNHVIQQSDGKVSAKLGASERAKHEADADRHTHKRHHELKDLSTPQTGPAQFRLAYDGPPPTVRRRPAPKPRPAPRPAPAPRPLPPAVVQKRSMGSDYRPPTVARAKPAKPKPYVLRGTGDQHWNDSNLRGQSVDSKVQRWRERHSHQQALANRDARRQGGDAVSLMPKLSKQEKSDLRSYKKSTRLAQDGALFAKDIREKREASERKRVADEKKQKEGGGLWGGLKKVAKGAGKVAVQATHVGLDVASYVPGPVGSGASAANAGIYFAQGDEKKGKEKLIEAAAGLIPIPGSKLAGKLVLKGAQAGAAKLAAKKAAGKTGTTIIKSAQRARKMIKQNRRSIEKAGRELYQDAIKDQGKAAANDAAGGEDYNFGKALVGTGTGKLTKKVASKFPVMNRKTAKSLARKRVAMLPIPEGVKPKLKGAAGGLAENTSAPTNLAADTTVKAVLEGNDDKKSKKKKKP